MHHKLIGGALAVMVLLLPANVNADTVFVMDTPDAGATVFGLVEVAGYIVDDGQECGPPPSWQACEWTDAEVSSIDLFVDNRFVASADMNMPRYDVLQAFPWYAGTPFARPGYSVSFDAKTYTNGNHSLFLRVTFSDQTIVDYGGRSVTVDNDLNQAPFGEIELPGENQPMNAVFPITGWALDDKSIAQVEVMVDGLAIGSAVTGIHRPDIANRFPSHHGAEYAGFIRMLNTTEMANGVHIIAVRVIDDEGASRVIGRRFVQTVNTAYNLPPFGGIDYPIPNHIMFGKGCSNPGGYSTPPYEDPQVVELVTGWALDVGSRTDPGGVAYLQLLIDGVIIADNNMGSTYWQWIQTDVDYYGHPRMDMQRLFPDVPNSKDCGFNFRVDVSDLLIRKGFRQGLHYLKVRAGDLENNVADIARIPVIFDCDDDPDRPSWGDIYAPANMEVVSGVTEVYGWAIDHDQAQLVEIWVDGNFIDYVDEYRLETPEVAAMFPWVATYNSLYAGFRYDFDTVNLNITDGEHHMVIWTEDYWGGRTIIGERVFLVDNLNKNKYK